MKHARPDYNRIQDPEGLIPEDEPVFLLRAQDKLAPEVVRNWAWMLRSRSNDQAAQAMATMAMKQSEKMEAWQRAHAVKMPDLP